MTQEEAVAVEAYLALVEKYQAAEKARRDKPQGISLPTEDVAEARVTDACGLIQDDGEYRLEVARRAADYL